jgi:type II secretion system protein D
MAREFGKSGRKAWSLGLGLRITAGILACGVSGFVAAADVDLPQGNATTAPSSADGAPKSPASDKATAAAKQNTERDHRVRLNFKAASWSRVLKRVAKHGDLTLVMKKCPPGTFTRTDLNQYTLAEAIWVLNRELEPAGYRLIRQGTFLMVLDLDDLRSDYRPSVTHRQPRTDDASKSQSASDARSGAGQPGDAAEPALLESVAPETARESAPRSKASDAANAEEDGAHASDTRMVRIYYMETSWSKALPRFAQQCGLTLVMKRCPSGTLHHLDFKKYSVPDAIQILNHELDDTNFRLVRQGDFLIVLYLEDIRAEYERPVVRVRRDREPRPEGTSDSRTAAAGSNSNVRQVSGVDSDVQLPQRASIGKTASSPFEGRQQESPSGSLRHDELPVTGPLLLESSASPSGPPQIAAGQRLDPPEEPTGLAATATTTVFVPQHGTAGAVARRLYATLKARSELLNSGLQGLPSFRVSRAAENKSGGGQSQSAARTSPAVAFTMGIDADHNRLVIEASPRCLAAVLRLCDRLDALGENTDAPVELVSADAETCAVAKNFAPELSRLIAQRDSDVGHAGHSGRETELAQAPSMPSGTEVRPGGQAGSATGQKGISEIIKGLKGDVSVESVPELGILVLRGGQSDVDAVMKVIKEIERLSVGATPQIHFLLLQYVNSESFAKLLNEVYKALSGLRTTAEGKQLISAFPIVKPNAVLVLAPPADMQSVLALAKQLDQPVNPDLEFQIFRLHHGYAAAVARSVSEFYKSPKGLGTTVNTFADTRTNSIVVQARPRDLAEVGKLIEQLDGPTASQATIKVFPLQNGDAMAIQRLLETLFGTQGQRPGGNQGAAPEETGTETTAPTQLRLSVDVRTNSIIALGPPDTLRSVEAVITRLDNSDVHQRQTKVIRLKNNASDNVARAITDFVRSQRDLQQIDPELMSNVELLEREVFVVSEPVSNSLLLSATPRYFEQLNQMIDKLDAPPAQVIIQALIVEVTLTNTDEFGIELGFQSPILFDRSNISNLTTLQTTQTVNPTTSVAQNVLLSSQASPGFQFGDPSTGLGTNPALGAAQVGSQELTNLGLGRVDPGLGFGGLVLSASSESVSALLRALSYKQTIHILSRPQIRTLDNRLASIQVGKRVPVVFGATANAVTGTLQPIIQYDNAGIILTVQPRITPDGMIALEAYAEKSQYEPGGQTILSTPGGSSLQSPIKDITRAEASVNVASGNTVVLGGMITSTDTVTTSKVPWLGDVPIIGQAFRYDSKSTVRTELLIFLTPRVIRDDADDEMIKQIETERIHFLVDEAESIHGPILSNKPPALEECPPDGMPTPLLLPVPPPSLPVPPAALPAPATPSAAPVSPPAAPVLPPPAMTPTGSRTPLNKPVSQSRAADETGAVRSASFEQPAWDTNSWGTDK